MIFGQSWGQRGGGCSDGIPQEALVPINGLCVTSNVIVGVNKGISVVHSGARQRQTVDIHCLFKRNDRKQPIILAAESSAV